MMESSLAGASSSAEAYLAAPEAAGANAARRFTASDGRDGAGRFLSFASIHSDSTAMEGPSASGDPSTEDLVAEARDTPGDMPNEDDYGYTPTGPTYSQTEEQEAETRAVESNLRRWAEQEKERRRMSRNQHAGVAGGGAALVRKLSSSISRMPSQRRAQIAARRERLGDTSIEMSPRGNSVQSPEDSSADNAPLAPEAHGDGDLGSSTLDQLGRDGGESGLPAQGAGSKGKGRDDQVTLYDTPASGPSLLSPSMDEGNRALDRARAANFPTVTVGRQSSVQYRRNSQRRAQRGSGGQPGTASAGGNGARRGQAPHRFSAVQEAESEQGHGDLSSAPLHGDATGEHLVSPAATMGSDPFRGDDVTDSATHRSGALGSDAGLTSEGSLHSGKAARRDGFEDIQLYSKASREQLSRHPENEIQTERPSWYWSDLLCGFGFCGSGDDDEDQAARTNPME